MKQEGEGWSNTSVLSCGLAVRPQLSSSSALCWSSSLTCVKGKWPRLPLHSPSHWPFTFILVTFTVSPTCGGREEKNVSDISARGHYVKDESTVDTRTHARTHARTHSHPVIIAIISRGPVCVDRNAFILRLI